MMFVIQAVTNKLFSTFLMGMYGGSLHALNRLKQNPNMVNVNRAKQKTIVSYSGVDAN